MAQKDFAAQNERVPDRAAPPRRERRHVLVVDDNRDCADSLQLVLSSLGHEVQVAYDGFQAMNEVLQESRAFDVVLLDLSMPGIDGFDLARRLRKAAPCCPSIVAVSGWADLPTKQKARKPASTAISSSRSKSKSCV